MNVDRIFWRDAYRVHSHTERHALVAFEAIGAFAQMHAAQRLDCLSSGSLGRVVRAGKVIPSGSGLCLVGPRLRLIGRRLFRIYRNLCVSFDNLLRLANVLAKPQ
jgi:hypothetical protein